VTFFEHWQEEQTMAQLEHAPIQRALSRVRELSVDRRGAAPGLRAWAGPGV